MALCCSFCRSSGDQGRQPTIVILQEPSPSSDRALFTAIEDMPNVWVIKVGFKFSTTPPAELPLRSHDIARSSLLNSTVIIMMAVNTPLTLAGLAVLL